METKKNIPKSNMVAMPLFNQPIGYPLIKGQADRLMKVLITKEAIIALSLGWFALASYLVRNYIQTQEEHRFEDTILHKTLALTTEQMTDFSAFFNDHWSTIFSHAHHRYKLPEAEAQDLSAKTFLRLLTHWKEYEHDDEDIKKGKLFLTLKRLRVNWYRDQSRQKRHQGGQFNDEIDQVPPENHKSVEDEVINKIEEEKLTDDQLRLLKAIEEISDPINGIILLCKLAGLESKEIAYIVGLSEYATKSRYHRILLGLRKQVRQDNAVDLLKQSGHNS